MWSIRSRSRTEPEGKVRRCARLLAWASVAALPAHAVTLHYEAFIAGARVGQATVHIAVVDDRYEVTGSARAEGVVEVFSAWHTRFRAHGQLVGEAVTPIEYGYVETDDDDVREITVRDGMFKYIKNGRKRREGAAPAGVDMLTALFVAPSCRSEQSVHSGRHYYLLTREATERKGVCRYQVVDEDADRYRADIRFGERGNLTIPVSITLKGWLTGRVVLVDQ